MGALLSCRLTSPSISPLRQWMRWRQRFIRRQLQLTSVRVRRWGRSSISLLSRRRIKLTPRTCRAPSVPYKASRHFNKESTIFTKNTVLERTLLRCKVHVNNKLVRQNLHFDLHCNAILLQGSLYSFAKFWNEIYNLNNWRKVIFHLAMFKSITWGRRYLGGVRLYRIRFIVHNLVLIQIA